MGKVFSWKLMAITSNDPSKWEGPIYSWLAAPGEATNSTQITGGFNDSFLIRSKNYAKTLDSIDAYSAAFERMKSELPYQYICTSGLKSVEDYFDIECESGNQKRWCGIEESKEEEVQEFTVTPTSSYSTSFTYRFVGKNTGNVTFFVDGVPTADPQKECVTVERDTTCTYTGTITASAFKTYRLSYETQRGTTGATQFERKQVNLTFSTTSATIAASATTYTFQYTAVPDAAITWDKGTCSSITASGHDVTVTVPENMDFTTKSYSASGTFTYAGQTATATITINQLEAVPYLHWVETSIVADYSSQQRTAHYTTNLSASEIIVESSNPIFSAETPGASSVVIRFPKNTGTTSRSTVLTLRSSRTTAETITLTQNEEGVEFSVSPTTLNFSHEGDSDVITATTKYCRIDDSCLNITPGNCRMEYEIVQNTTSISSNSGVAIIEVTFEGYNEPGPGNGILAKKTGYVSARVDVQCGVPASETLSKIDSTYELTITPLKAGDVPVGTETVTIVID